MSPEAQRRALCSIVPNWRVADPSGMSGLCHWLHADGTQMLSDPLEDLNAMHAAIKAQPDNIQWLTFAILADIVDAKIPAYMGTATQWAEALLKALGKWK